MRVSNDEDDNSNDPHPHFSKTAKIAFVSKDRTKEKKEKEDKRWCRDFELRVVAFGILSTLRTFARLLFIERDYVFASPLIQKKKKKKKKRKKKRRKLSRT